jgi:hypothetical protein
MPGCEPLPRKEAVHKGARLDGLLGRVLVLLRAAVWQPPL